ncbi:MAG: MoaD/ThiS family protein [Flavobacteriaceae bacterium]
MKLHIKYFGLLTEITHCEEETIVFTGKTISDLLEQLFEKYPSLQGKDFQVAQNNQVTPRGETVSSNEIALLPPFSGG